MKWKKSEDMLSELRGLYSGLCEGTVSVEDARAANNILKNAVKIVELELEHARMTSRLVEGSAHLPPFERG